MMLRRTVCLGVYILILSFSVRAESTDKLRKVFHESVLHSDKLPLFIKEIETIQNPNAIEKAYIGALEALRARDTWNPLEKIMLIQKFRGYLIEAIESDSENLEIRFIRFAIEFNIPSLLRSDKSISEDKVMIMNKLSKINSFEVDPFFIRYILRLFEDSRLCTELELTMIRDKIAGS